MMKPILSTALLTACVCSLTVQAAPENDFRTKVIVNAYQPDRDDEYEDSEGIEVQFQSWVLPNFALALAIGHAAWDVTDDGGIRFTEGMIAFDGRQSGDVTLIPIGLSGIANFQPLSNLRLQVEGGLRYVRTDENLSQTASLPPDGRDGELKLDMDDAFILVIAAEAELILTDALSLFAGVGYQHDLEHAEVSASVTDEVELNSDSSFNALFGRVGAALKF